MADVTPVNIVGADSPIPVVVEEQKKPDRLVKQDSRQTLAPNTTEQEDVTAAGQRRINLIWELTQAIIAISITWAVIYTAIKETESSILTNAFFLIVSMYFVRTNHKLIGGVGYKPPGESR